MTINTKQNFINFLLSFQNIYSDFHRKEVKMNNAQLELFLESSFSLHSVEKSLSPGELLKDFISILEIMKDSNNNDLEIFLKPDNEEIYGEEIYNINLLNNKALLN